jgi:thiosulfate reductase cytochrome b subunit
MVMIGLLISLTLTESTDSEGESSQASSAQLLLDGFRLLGNNKLFRRLALLSLATIPFRDYLGSLYQPHFVDADVPPLWFGLALSIASGLSILGARHAHWIEDRLGSEASLLLVTALPGVLYVAMAAVSHPACSVLVFCALYGSMSLKGPIFAGQLNKHIASRNRATVLSMISMVSGVHVSLMGLLIGRIADASVPYAFVFMGIVVLVGSLTLQARQT